MDDEPHTETILAATRATPRRAALHRLLAISAGLLGTVGLTSATARQRSAAAHRHGKTRPTRPAMPHANASAGDGAPAPTDDRPSGPAGVAGRGKKKPGPTGPTGVTGPTGGAASLSITRTQATTSFGSGDSYGEATAWCAAGQRVLTGGFDGSLTNGGGVPVSSIGVTGQDGREGWRVRMVSNDTRSALGGTFTAYAYCLDG